MTDLRAAAAEYLAIRRSLGFKLRDYDRLLEDFIGSLEASGTETVTVQSALTWATSVTGTSPKRCGDRLGAVRGFARHLHGFDHTVEGPPPYLLVYRQLRPRPYLYSAADIARLVRVASALRPAFRGLTYETVFGLLATTGMRVGEALRLDDGDVDLQTGVIEITDTKFNKHRLVPVHASVLAALRHYVEVRDEQRFRRAKDPSFFVSTQGTRLFYTSVNEAFHVLLGELHLDAQHGAGTPRIHGLRHSFAVATVRDWYRSGQAPEGKLPILSAYLGHARPASTYWYLEACPELLGLAAERLERFEKGQR
jgi:integrase